MADSRRRPAVAGQFYEGGSAALTAQIEAAYLDDRGPGALPEVSPQGPRRLLALVCPHAGYLYSAPVAAFAFAALARDGRPDTVVVVGPNHGRGSWVSAIQTSGSWLTPLGEMRVDADLAGALARELPALDDDANAFRAEHSLEVQLPFLQHLYGDAVGFVPVMMLDQGWEAARALGEALGRVLAGRNAVIVASTDMTHQEPRATASAQDKLLASVSRRWSGGADPRAGAARHHDVRLRPDCGGDRRRPGPRRLQRRDLQLRGLRTGSPDADRRRLPLRRSLQGVRPVPRVVGERGTGCANQKGARS